MSTKLIPMFLNIKCTTNKSNLANIAEKKQLDLKKNMKFQEVEIKNDFIKFKDGFPIISLVIKNSSVEIISIYKDKESVYKEIVTMFKLLELPTKQSLTLDRYELISILNFENEKALSSFFINSLEDDEFGEIIQSSMNFKVIRDNQTIRYYFDFNENGKANFANISLESPLEIIIDNNFKEKFFNVDKFLFDSMDSFLRTRHIPAALNRGISNEPVSK
jgi:hypothetical protein